jgi:hypothetical protein
MESKPDGTGASGELRLGYDTRAMIRTGLVTFLAAGSISALWIIAADQVFDLQTGFAEPWSRGKPIGFGIGMGFLGVVIMRLVLFLRQPKGARVTWDATGITEWDGEDKRVTIRWDKARVSDKLLIMNDKDGKPVAVAGQICQITDPDKNFIELSQGTQPMWMNGRRNSADVTPMTPYLASVMQIKPINRGEGSIILKWLAAIAGYVGLLLGLLMFAQSHGISDQQGFLGSYLILGGAAMLVMRALWPLFSGLRAGGANAAARAWRNAGVIEFVIRLVLAVVAALPALPALGLSTSGGAGAATWRELIPGKRLPTASACTADGARLIRGSTQQIIWKRTKDQTLRHRTNADYSMRYLALDPTGRYAIFPSVNGFLSFWNADTNQVKTSTDKHGHNITMLRFSPDGRVLVTVSLDKTAKVWNPVDAGLLHTLAGHTAAINCLAFSPDGKQLATGGYAKVLIWDTTTWQPAKTIEGYPTTVQVLAWSANGAMLAVGEYQGGLSLAGIAEGRKLRDLEPHEGGVAAVRFLPGGNHLLSAGRDQTMRIYELETGDVVDELNLRTNDRYKEVRDYVREFLPPRGTSLKAITHYGGLIEIQLPPEVTGVAPGKSSP